MATASTSTDPRGRTLRYAPGARVEVRDEEWMVRRVEPSATGGHALTVVGVSDLVRGTEAIFLDGLDTVTVLDPRQTRLEADRSPGYRKTRLYLESLLRQSPVTDAGITTGHRGAIKPSQYQLTPAGLALSQPRARILIADGVGLGSEEQHLIDGIEAGQAPEDIIPEPAEPLRDAAVDAALEHMSELRTQRSQELRPKLNAEVRRLKKWAGARVDTIEDQLAAESRPARTAKLEQQRVDVETLQAARRAWFEETMTTEDQPYLRLAVVLVEG